MVFQMRTIVAAPWATWTLFLLTMAGDPFCSQTYGQLQTLSRGNVDQQWRQAQLQTLDRQLGVPGLPAELKLELAAQRKWLAAWDPKKSEALPPQTPSPHATLIEPSLDPSGLATELRETLFHPDRPPSTKDTTALQTALKENPDDVGLRQLQMQWLDQPKYRDDYWKQIADACTRVAVLALELPASQASTSQASTSQDSVSEEPGKERGKTANSADNKDPKDKTAEEDAASEDTESKNESPRSKASTGRQPTSEEAKLAAAFAHYRQARALAHCLRGQPYLKAKVAGADKLSATEREQMQSTMAECFRNIEELVGTGHAEFLQLEIYVLQRDGWKGRALELLERHANTVERLAYLQARHGLLQSLGWTSPAAQVAAEMHAEEESGSPRGGLKIDLLDLATRPEK